MEKTNYRILIVDDEPPWHGVVRHAFIEDYEFEGAETIDKMWTKLEKSGTFDLLLLDLKLDSTQKNIGLDLIAPIKEKYPQVPIIIATNENDPDVILEAMETGAKGYLIKSAYNKEKWTQKFQDAIQAQKAPQLERKNKVLEAQVEQLTQVQEDEKYRFIGQSSSVEKIKTQLEALAREHNITVLINGETGTGKEVAARYLHKMGTRAGKPFVGVNLSAIQKTLLESTLFGARKGGYTGAVSDVKGYFEQANGGILMLDEIGDIDADIQIKLLRFLETRQIRPIGSDKDLELDVQIITATHRNLPQLVADGIFREDLYHRLKMWVIELPPLRERREDILLIIEHYMKLQLGDVKPLEIMEPEVYDKLLTFSWPGNIRQLRYAVDQMLLSKRMFSKDIIDLDCLPDDIRNGTLIVPATKSNVQEKNAHNQRFRSKKEESAHLDLVKIEGALRETRGNKTEAADILGYKGTDHLRARIRTCYQNYEEMFAQFPLICEHYSSVMK